MYILHIGTNKTGTSSIQQFLNSNHDLLQQHDAIYPELGLHNNSHHNLARVLMGAENTFDVSETWETELKTLSRKYTKVIISSELLHTCDDPLILRRFFPKGKTKIVLYIREHFAFVRSWYQQAVQLRNITSKFEEFVDLDYVNPNYQALIEKWSKAFGAKNIIVRGYDRNLLINSDIVADFLNACEIDIQPLDYSSFNTSISGNLLFYKLIANNFISQHNDYVLAREIVELSKVDSTFSGSMAVNPEIFNKLKFKFHKDRHFIRKKYGFELKPKLNNENSHQSPNMATLDDDIQKIIKYGKENNLQITDNHYTRLFNIGINGKIIK